MFLILDVVAAQYDYELGQTGPLLSYGVRRRRASTLHVCRYIGFLGHLQLGRGRDAAFAPSSSTQIDSFGFIGEHRWAIRHVPLHPL